MPELIIFAGAVVAMAILIGVSVWAWVQVRNDETRKPPFHAERGTVEGLTDRADGFQPRP